MTDDAVTVREALENIGNEGYNSTDPEVKAAYVALDRLVDQAARADRYEAFVQALVEVMDEGFDIIVGGETHRVAREALDAETADA